MVIRSWKKTNNEEHQEVLGQVGSLVDCFSLERGLTKEQSSRDTARYGAESDQVISPPDNAQFGRKTNEDEER